jgi:hypothetical protein
MPEPDLIQLFVQPLNQLGVRYLVSGSVASTLYGEPRVTHDIDLVVFLRSQETAALSKAFPSPTFYVPPPEAIVAEIGRGQGGHFNIIHTDSGLKAGFYLASRDDFYAWAFRHARRYSIWQTEVSLAPPEYVIVQKLRLFKESGSEKHLRDIRSMIAVSGDKLDKKALAGWIQEFGLETEWRLVG